MKCERLLTRDVKDCSLVFDDVPPPPPEDSDDDNDDPSDGRLDMENPEIAEPMATNVPSATNTLPGLQTSNPEPCGPADSDITPPCVFEDT